MLVHFKAMTHQPTEPNCRVRLGPIDVCVIDLQLDFFLHSGLIPDGLVLSRPPYYSAVGLGWVVCHRIYSQL